MVRRCLTSADWIAAKQKEAKSSMLLEAYFWYQDRRRLARLAGCRLGDKSAKSSCSYLAAITLGLLAMLNTTITSSSHALRITNLDLPRTALQGDTIELGCAFELESSNERDAQLSNNAARKSLTLVDGSDADGDNLYRANSSNALALNAPEVLYAVKWYKDECEFFRYLAREEPHKEAFPMDGVHVDVARSNNQTITLKSISLKTSGLYRCEVSTDAPNFVTESIERDMLVYALPNEGPTIENVRSITDSSTSSVQPHYFIGDVAELRCFSHDSKPVAQLDWIINDKLNLSAPNMALVASTVPNSKPVFSVHYKRHVRIAASPSNTQRQSNEQPQQNHDKANTAPNRSLFRVLELSQLNADSAQISTTAKQRQVENSPRINPINLTSKSLDRMAEFATSTLSFTITPDLIRTLSDKLTIPKVTNYRAAIDKVSLNKSVQARRHTTAIKPLETSDRNQSRWRKVDAGGSHTSTAYYVRNSINGPKFQIKISCVARVLHLKMSDQIRLRIINKTRLDAAQESALASEKSGRWQVEKNSGRSDLGLAIARIGMLFSFINLISIINQITACSITI